MTEIDPGAGAAAKPAPDEDTPDDDTPDDDTPDEDRRAHARARKRLNDAGARVTAEARIESREQVRELMGWS